MSDFGGLVGVRHEIVASHAWIGAGWHDEEDFWVADVEGGLPKRTVNE